MEGGGGEERIRHFSSLLPARAPFFASLPLVLFSLLLRWRPRLITPSLQANCRGFWFVLRLFWWPGFTRNRLVRRAWELLYCYKNYFTENEWGFFEAHQADSSVLVSQNASCLGDSYKLLHIRGSEKKKPNVPI